MAQEELQHLAEKIVLGTATEADVALYNRICHTIETAPAGAFEMSAEEEQQLGAAMKTAVLQRTAPAKVHRISWTKWVAAAACVALIIVLGNWILTRSSTAGNTTAQNEKQQSANTTVHHESNATGKEKRLSLPDGSLVVLAPQSEVTYGEPFATNRNIQLSGKAFFSVAKDKNHPFTVVSGAISTTALGTQFTITTFRQSGNVIVRLYEGKVVVKPVSGRNPQLKGNVYLLPGQAYVYGNHNIATIKNLEEKNHTAPEKILDEEVIKDNPALPENARSPYFMFNNQPLSEVFDNLAALYNVSIVYNKQEIKNLYFIGKYNSSDAIDTILKRIAALNGLTVTQNNDAYIISK